MKFTPPFYFVGEAGKGVGLDRVSLQSMGVQDGVLSLRSMDVGVLTFTLQDNGRRSAIPDDKQWLTLVDDAGRRCFVGKVKRSYKYPERVYSFEVSDVYKALGETQILGANGRPFITYFADDLGRTLRDVVERAGRRGLPVAVGPMAGMYAVPKMSFRSTTFSTALEDALKWVPGVATRMNYETVPPELGFYSRHEAETFGVNLYAGDGLEIELTANDEQRALGISFSYAVRSGDTTVTLATQVAGDPLAEGVERQSAYLTGADRMDAFLGEALVAALYAQEEVNRLIVAGGGTVADNNPEVEFTWENCLALDNSGVLAAAVAAEPGFTMEPGGSSFGTDDGWYQHAPYSASLVGPYNNGITVNSSPLYAASATGVPLVAWYAVKAGFFTADELSSVGIQLQPGFILGDLVRTNYSRTFTDGESVIAAFPGNRRIIQNTDKGRIWTRFSAYLPVDVIDKPPSVALSLLAANNDGFNAKLVTRAGYADIPRDLGANYFERQNFTPFSGTISLLPGREFPLPGEFVSVCGDDIPAEWETMKAAVAKTDITLSSMEVTVTLGASPRLPAGSLSDRLRIPFEDNFQPG